MLLITNTFKLIVCAPLLLIILLFSIFYYWLYLNYLVALILISGSTGYSPIIEFIYLLLLTTYRCVKALLTYPLRYTIYLFWRYRKHPKFENSPNIDHVVKAFYVTSSHRLRRVRQFIFELNYWKTYFIITLAYQLILYPLYLINYAVAILYYIYRVFTYAKDSRFNELRWEEPPSTHPLLDFEFKESTPGHVVFSWLILNSHTLAIRIPRARAFRTVYIILKSINLLLGASSDKSASTVYLTNFIILSTVLIPAVFCVVLCAVLLGLPYRLLTTSWQWSKLMAIHYRSGTRGRTFLMNLVYTHTNKIWYEFFSQELGLVVALRIYKNDVSIWNFNPKKFIGLVDLLKTYNLLHGKSNSLNIINSSFDTKIETISSLGEALDSVEILSEIYEELSYSVIRHRTSSGIIPHVSASFQISNDLVVGVNQTSNLRTDSEPVTTQLYRFINGTQTRYTTELSQTSVGAVSTNFNKANLQPDQGLWVNTNLGKFQLTLELLKTVRWHVLEGTPLPWASNSEDLDKLILYLNHPLMKSLLVLPDNDQLLCLLFIQARNNNFFSLVDWQLIITKTF